MPQIGLAQTSWVPKITSWESVLHNDFIVWIIATELLDSWEAERGHADVKEIQGKFFWLSDVDSVVLGSECFYFLTNPLEK